MIDLKITITFIFKNDKEPIKKEVSLWHGHLPFAFVDDSNLKKIIVAGRHFYNQEEYNAFQYGVDYVRSLLVSFANRDD